MGGQFVVRADNSWFSCNTENGEVTTFESISFQSESATFALRDTGGGGTISPVFRRAEVMANTVLLIEDQCPTTFSNPQCRAGVQQQLARTGPPCYNVNYTLSIDNEAL